MVASIPPTFLAAGRFAHESDVVSDPRSALVTGASRGIGRSIALRLARKGYGVTITARGEDALGAVAEELAAAGAPQVEVVAADSADRDAVADVAKTHRERFGAMDALVLNAGVGTAGSLEETDLRRLDKTFDVNFVSAAILIRESLDMLRRAAELPRSNGSRIIALSSITGVFAEPGLGVYGASKAALLSLIETTNLEEAGNGVTATAIAPAFVDTDMSAWVSNVIEPGSMIPTSDVVDVVEMLLGLSGNSVIGRIVMSRAGTSGYCA